jgi:hypothetical protein
MTVQVDITHDTSAPLSPAQRMMHAGCLAKVVGSTLRGIWKMCPPSEVDDGLRINSVRLCRWEAVGRLGSFPRASPLLCVAYVVG